MAISLPETQQMTGDPQALVLAQHPRLSWELPHSCCVTLLSPGAITDSEKRNGIDPPGLSGGSGETILRKPLAQGLELRKLSTHSGFVMSAHRPTPWSRESFCGLQGHVRVSGRAAATLPGLTEGQDPLA